MGLDIFVSNYPGALDDQVKNFLLDNTTGTNSSWSYNDLWLQFLTENGATSGSIDDRTKYLLVIYLTQQGVILDGSETIDDLWGLVTTPYAG